MSKLNTLITLLVFDSRNRLLVQQHSDNGVEIPLYPSSSCEGSYLLTTADIEGELTEIHCRLNSEVTPGNEFISLYQLRSLEQSSHLKAILQAIEPHLYRLPYLDLGENEYIYRFRTAKERNRSIYVDTQSDALYQ
ncbi:MAG: hypothetical protein NWR36_07325, partial [Opitutales bacterium]|nr:hypothetical protein [Opitutales bacterium]